MNFYDQQMFLEEGLSGVLCLIHYARSKKYISVTDEQVQQILDRIKMSTFWETEEVKEFPFSLSNGVAGLFMVESIISNSFSVYE